MQVRCLDSIFVSSNRGNGSRIENTKDMKFYTFAVLKHAEREDEFVSIEKAVATAKEWAKEYGFKQQSERLWSGAGSECVVVVSEQQLGESSLLDYALSKL